MKKIFLISTLISFFYFIFSIFINIPWIKDIACQFRYFLAIYLVLFIAIIPGFIFVFMFISLLLNKKEKHRCDTKEKDVTVLIPLYNAQNSIKETVNSIINQKYCGNILIYMIDDGSTDDYLPIVKSMNLDSKITLIKSPHVGKAKALNEALKYVRTKYTITVDSDTVLHPLAIKNIVQKLENSDKNTAAVAGCLLVKNAKKNFITKLQEWDYTLGIFGVKLYQGNYNSTLVAQGAFSIYKTNILKQIGGWQNCVGEDIVLTWELLSRGYTTSFAKDAIALTEVPESLKDLKRQRKRWARGMIEAFKKVKTVTSLKMKFKSKFLICLNIFFPFIDIATLIFIPLGIILLLLGNNLLISWLYLLVILFGLLLCLIIDIKRKHVLKKLDYKLKRRSILAFLVYTLLYTFILAPSCLVGYISEIINSNKKW